MKILDGHIHIWERADKSKELLSEMGKAGVEGGCLFSAPPLEMKLKGALPFEERLSSVLSWVSSYPDRLFPVLWIHPDEENIIENVHIAAGRGIMAFKIICNNFHVYEEKSLKLLREIAKLNKPVFFHSGILWDGGNSSSYNRPLDWECLIEIKNLRFSMGHCSWPWHDECIALYGKFLNAYNGSDNAEMFFDITPGTPAIYRKDLMEKLFLIGYDVPKNIFFGTDCSADSYKSAWADEWIKRDNSIYDELMLPGDIRKDIYCNNLLRFLGLSPKTFTHLTPSTDSGAPWYIGVKRDEEKVRDIACKYFNKLSFPYEYRSEFEAKINKLIDLKACTIDSYDVCDDMEMRFKNLAQYLYFCEALHDKYKHKNIPDSIFFDTIEDIVRWTKTNYSITGSLGICEASWLKRHMSFNIFKLGRLQFAFGAAECDIEDIGVKKGDKIIEVHIPDGGPLSYDECEKSFDMAKDFFAQYFSEYKYKCFTCHSWLLDDSLKLIAKEGSNIVKFQSFFKELYREKSEAILRYTFTWDTNINNLSHREAGSSFAKAIKERIETGKCFYEVYGYKN